MINPRLAFGIGRPDRAVGFQKVAVGGQRQNVSPVIKGGGGNDASGAFSNTTNISLGVGGLFVLGIIGLYWWTRNHQA